MKSIKDVFNQLITCYKRSRNLKPIDFKSNAKINKNISDNVITLNNELTVNIDGKSVDIELSEVQIDELLDNIKVVEKFTPNVGDPYFYVYKYNGEYKINSSIFIGDRKYESLNSEYRYVFKTEAEAKLYKRYLDALSRYTNIQTSALNLPNYCIGYDIHSDTFEIQTWRNVYLPTGLPVFRSKDSIKRFIHAVGKDNIKHFMFNI